MDGLASIDGQMLPSVVALEKFLILFLVARYVFMVELLGSDEYFSFPSIFSLFLLENFKGVLPFCFLYPIWSLFTYFYLFCCFYFFIFFSSISFLIIWCNLIFFIQFDHYYFDSYLFCCFYFCSFKSHTSSVGLFDFYIKFNSYSFDCCLLFFFFIFIIEFCSQCYP